MIGILTEEERRLIGNLVETGVALSAEKLGELSGTIWSIVSHSVCEVSYVNVLAMYQPDETPHMASHLRSRSLLPLEILLLFPDQSMRAVTAAVTRANGERLARLPDKERMILAEVSNILGQGVIRAMVNALKISVILTVPKLMRGKKAGLLAQALTDFDDKTDTLILSHVEMHSANLQAECTLILILDTAVMRRLLKVALPGS